MNFKDVFIGKVPSFLHNQGSFTIGAEMKMAVCALLSVTNMTVGSQYVTDMSGIKFGRKDDDITIPGRQPC